MSLWCQIVSNRHRDGRLVDPGLSASAIEMRRNGKGGQTACGDRTMREMSNSTLMMISILTAAHPLRFAAREHVHLLGGHAFPNRAFRRSSSALEGCASPRPGLERKSERAQKSCAKEQLSPLKSLSGGKLVRRTPRWRISGGQAQKAGRAELKAEQELRTRRIPAKRADRAVARMANQNFGLRRRGG